MAPTHQKTSSPYLVLVASLLGIFFLFCAAGIVLTSFLSVSASPLLILKAAGLFLIGIGILAWLVLSKKGKSQLPLEEDFETQPCRFWPVGISFVLLVGILTVPRILTHPTGADEGMWANVIRNLILYSRYALGQPGSFQDFSPVISVGPTVIVPLFILSKWISASLWLFRAYACMWLLTALTALYFLYSKLLKGVQIYAALILALIFFQHTGIQAGCTTVMGEMPALFFLTMGVLFLPRRLFWSGLFFGLAIVTKLTLFLLLTLPFVFILYRLSRGQRINGRPLIFFLAGVFLPLLSWFWIRASLTNVPARDSLQTVSEFLLFGFRNLDKRILRYGLKHFIQLFFLLGLASFYIRKSLNEGRAKARELAIWSFSLFLILWFFSCTDGHFVRYTTYPLFLLIPLAVNAIPRNLKPFLILSPLIFFLFLDELGNAAKVLTFQNRRNLPWLSEQLKKELKSIPAPPSIWTLNEMDGYNLSTLNQPPVFWVREEMFFDGLRPVKPYLASSQINVKIPQTNFLPLSIRTGDFFAVGVPQGKGGERKLYLLHVVHSPKEKSHRFLVDSDLPEELKETLQNNFESLGLDHRFVRREERREKKTYGLALRENSTPAV